MNMHESLTDSAHKYKFQVPSRYGPKTQSYPFHQPGHCLQMGNGRIKSQKLNEVARLNIMYTGYDRTGGIEKDVYTKIRRTI